MRLIEALADRHRTKRIITTEKDKQYIVVDNLLIKKRNLNNKYPQQWVLRTTLTWDELNDLVRPDNQKPKGKNMVEKIDIDYDSPCRLRQEYGQKINEIIDDLHELKALYKECDKSLTAAIESINIHERQIDKLQMMLEPHKCETRPENVLTKTLRMDKEFAEDECVRLQDELGRTKRALEIAVKHLREITDVGGWVSVFSEQEIAQQALEQITALEQKDK